MKGAQPQLSSQLLRSVAVDGVTKSGDSGISGDGDMTALGPLGADRPRGIEWIGVPNLLARQWGTQPLMKRLGLIHQLSSTLGLLQLAARKGISELTTGGDLLRKVTSRSHLRGPVGTTTGSGVVLFSDGIAIPMFPCIGEQRRS